MQPSIARAVAREYERRRQQAELERDQRVLALHARLPELADLDRHRRRRCGLVAGIHRPRPSTPGRSRKGPPLGHTSAVAAEVKNRSSL